MCNCEFAPYPEGDGKESYHYFRTCLFCGHEWYGLHCPHDGYQNPCSQCGKYPIVWPDVDGVDFVQRRQQMDNGNFLESVLSPLQPILSTIYVQRIEKDHEQALIENKTRIKDWATIGKGEEVWLTGIFRGVGGDNAFYEVRGTPPQKIIVCVGWALLTAYNTSVIIDDGLVAEFNDLEYIQPHVALARLGYVVHGTVDFAQAFSTE